MYNEIAGKEDQIQNTKVTSFVVTSYTEPTSHFPAVVLVHPHLTVVHHKVSGEEFCICGVLIVL